MHKYYRCALPPFFFCERLFLCQFYGTLTGHITQTNNVKWSSYIELSESVLTLAISFRTLTQLMTEMDPFLNVSPQLS